MDAEVAAFILNMESFFTLKEELGVLADNMFMLHHRLVWARILLLLGFPQFSDTQLMLPPEFMGSLELLLPGSFGSKENPVGPI